MKAIRINSQSKYGYDYVTTTPDGIETVIEITSKTTDGYLKLPEIVNGRKLVSLKQLANNGESDFILDDLKPQTRTKTESTEKSPKSSKAPKIEELVALLTDDERKIYKELMDKAVARLAKQKKIDELERMRKEIAELEASINSMN